MTDVTNRYMYVGVTNHLKRRVNEHKSEIITGYTQRYHIHKLVYYEEYHEINDAIAREKQLKGWRRAKKNALVFMKNPKWDDWSCDL